MRVDSAGVRDGTAEARDGARRWQGTNGVSAPGPACASLDDVIDATRCRDGYRLLRQDARLDCWTVMQVEGIDLDALRAGAIMPDVEEPVRVTLSAWGRRHSDLLEQPCLVVSSVTRAALSDAGVDNVEYFPATLRMEITGDVFPDYWVANVVGTVSCVDRDASAFEPVGDGPQGALRAFEVDPARTQGLLLFRLAEDRRLVLVHERVATALLAAGLQGLLLQDTRAYDGYPASTDPDGLAAETPVPGAAGVDEPKR